MRYININEHAKLPDVSSHAPFKALLAADGPVSASVRNTISKWLVENGCRYVVAWGAESAAWIDAVRTANLDGADLETLHPRDFIMVTSHRYESLRRVAGFAAKGARHPEHTLDELLVVDLDRRNRSTEFEVACRRA